jgi:hypothetical protein
MCPDIRAECYFAKRNIIAGSMTDFRHIVDNLTHLCGDDDEVSAYWGWLTIKTRNLLLLPFNWCQVEAVAKALLEQKTLKYKDARSIAKAAQEDLFLSGRAKDGRIEKMWAEIREYRTRNSKKGSAK